MMAERTATMALGDRVFLYCERGTSQALLAEPLNAASNGAFLLAALVALVLVLRLPREEQSSDHFLLIGLVFLIGLGSLALHLFANQGAALADVIPISVFMLVYLGFALNRFVGVPPGWTVLIVIGFAALMSLTGQVECWKGGIGMPGPGVEGAKPCLNGSIGYLPALGALIIVGLLLSETRHRAAPYLLWAGAIFAVSITLRTLDPALCDEIVIEGRKVGTHFLWHTLNALALFLLLRASLEGWRGGATASSDGIAEEAVPPQVAANSSELIAAGAEPAERVVAPAASTEAVIEPVEALRPMQDEEREQQDREDAPSEEDVAAPSKELPAASVPADEVLKDDPLAPMKRLSGISMPPESEVEGAEGPLQQEAQREEALADAGPAPEREASKKSRRRKVLFPT
jgi:hypothetical protein